MKILKILSINLIIIFLLTEILLRVVWQSPYVPSYEDAYFHEPNQEILFKNISKIYGEKETVSFRTNRFGSIIGPKGFEEIIKNDFGIALGGSTTECALVPENKRWPDLIGLPTLNFGKSRLDSSHTKENLKYLLKNYGLKPKKVFIMDGANNLSAFLSRGQDALQNKDTKQSLYSLILKSSYSTALLWSYIKSYDYLTFYKTQVALNNKIPLIQDSELEEFWNLEKKAILRSQEEVFRALNDIGGKDVSILILTQPHSFEEYYKPETIDLRWTPVIKNKRLSILQSKWLVDLYNQTTIEAAKNIGLESIDISSCFQKEPIDGIFYDSWHFTERGSNLFANCLSSSLF